MDMREKIVAQQQEHQDQFDIAVNAAITNGIGDLFDASWKMARGNGALPNPWITSMFVLVTSMLLKKFTANFGPDMPDDHKVQAISEAKQIMIGYLDQMEAAAIKEVYNPLPLESESTITSKGKSKIILPKKRKFQH